MARWNKIYLEFELYRFYEFWIYNISTISHRDWKRGFVQMLKNDKRAKNRVSTEARHAKKCSLFVQVARGKSHTCLQNDKNLIKTSQDCNTRYNHSVLKINSLILSNKIHYLLKNLCEPVSEVLTSKSDNLKVKL